MYKNKKLWAYVIKFAVVFCVCYFGTLLVIGLSAREGYYIPFVAKYFDYVSWIKISLLSATGFILSLFNIQTHTEPGFLIRINGGRGVIIAMDCVGYGVYSFWAAFVIANSGKFLKKIFWIVSGLIALWFVNVIRISLFLTSINRGWRMPLGLDHHSWFTIAAYLLIFFLIWLYDRSFREDALNNSSF